MGITIVFLTLATGLGCIALREQLLQGGVPLWLEQTVAANEETGVRDRRPFFPELFNLFGGAAVAAAAVAGRAAPAAEEVVEDAEENEGMPQPPPYTTAPTPTSTGQIPSPSTTTASSGSSGDHTEPPLSTSVPDATQPLGDGPLPVQAQEFGWRAADNDSDRETNAGIPEAADDGEEGQEHEEEQGQPMDEAMNWDRVLGFDGSLAFLEHVLWLIAVNTLFIVIFAFCPFYVGQFTILGFKLEKLIAATRMEGVSTILVGYVVVAAALMLLHCGCNYLGKQRASYWFGLGYVYIKVALVSLLEVGIFPTLCGFWIDACILTLFNVTLTDRINVFNYAPIAFTFIHWAVGMLYIFYMASLLLLARTVVRPGVLRFVYHFNDPDYKPIQDSIWGILIVFMFWVPIELVRRLLPGFLPFQITIAYENPLDYSVEIILIQVVLPLLLDGQAKVMVRQMLRTWCVVVSTALGIRSYLIGDEPFVRGDWLVQEDGTEVPFTEATNDDSDPTETRPNDENDVSNLVLQAHSMLQADAQPPQGGDENADQAPADDAHAQDDDNGMDDDAFRHYVPYARPPHYFVIRLCLFGIVVLLSLMFLSSALLFIPVGVGRIVLQLVSAGDSKPKHDAVALVTGVTLLGVVLRLTKCLPLFIGLMRRATATLLTRATNLFYRCQPWRVLRIWTRSGTTCEIAIPRPALPAPQPQRSVLQSQLSRMHYSANGLLTPGEWLPRLYAALHLAVNVMRLAGVAALFLILLPVCLGLLINLVFIIPFQVGPRKTLVIGFWEHWIFGVMHLKVATLLTLIGPPSWLRHRLESMQTELVQRRFHARSTRLLADIIPILVTVGLCLALPYLLAHHIGIYLGVDLEFAVRYSYPGLFASVLVLTLGVLQIQQLQKVYTRIKDEKYLVGRRLVNFRTNPTSELAAVDSPPMGAI